VPTISILLLDHLIRFATWDKKLIAILGIFSKYIHINLDIVCPHNSPLATNLPYMWYLSMSHCHVNESECIYCIPCTNVLFVVWFSCSAATSADLYRSRSTSCKCWRILLKFSIGFCIGERMSWKEFGENWKFKMATRA
jgi:hypothetical protein